MTKADIPPYDDLMNPVLQALKKLGGSGTIEEIHSKASEIAGLSDEQLEVLHNPEKGGQTEVEYRLAWARTYLKINLDSKCVHLWHHFGHRPKGSVSHKERFLILRKQDPVSRVKRVEPGINLLFSKFTSFEPCLLACPIN